MASLPLNTTITPLLKDKYKFGLAILPFGCMFASIGLIVFPFIMSLGDWMLMVLMSGGYLFGWLLNALVARYVYGMSRQAIRSIYLQGSVPRHWFADGGWHHYCQNWIIQQQNLQQLRAKGKHRFVARITVSYYLIYLLLSMAIPHFYDKSGPGWLHLIWPGFLWLLGFIALSLMLWHNVEKSCKDGQQRIDLRDDIVKEAEATEIEIVEVKKGLLSYLSSMLVSLLFISLGLMFWWPNWTNWTKPDHGLPSYTALSEFTGKAKIDLVNKNGLKFYLEGSTTKYYAKYFDQPTQWLAEQLKDQVVTIHADLNNSHGPMFSDERVHNIFELSIDGQLLIEYDSTYAKIKEEQKHLPYISIFFLLLGLASGWFTHWQFRKSRAQQS